MEAQAISGSLEQGERRAPTAPTQPTIVIVDDEPQVLVALEDILSDRFHVIATESPEEAVRVVEGRDDICVVISDQRMPTMTGDQLLSAISKRSNAQRILVTGYADLQAVIRAVNEGQIFAYVAKPWEVDDLQAKVLKAAECHRLASALRLEQQLLRDLMNNMPDGIYFKGPDLRFLRANGPIARLLNQEVGDDLVGRHLAELPGTPAGAQQVEAEEERVVSRNTPVTDAIREFGEGPERRWYSETKVPILDHTGAAIGLVGICRDVTERVLAEQARMTQQQRTTRLSSVLAILSGINSAIVWIREGSALLDAACKIAVREGKLAHAMVVAFDQNEGRLSLMASADDEAFAVDAPESPGERFLRDASLLLQRALSVRSVVVSNSTEALNSRGLTELVAQGYHSVAVFPLFASGELQSLFVLASGQGGSFDAEEVRLLTELADNLSFALDHIAESKQVE